MEKKRCKYCGGKRDSIIAEAPCSKVKCLVKEITSYWNGRGYTVEFFQRTAVIKRIISSDGKVVYYNG